MWQKIYYYRKNCAEKYFVMNFFLMTKYAMIGDEILIKKEEKNWTKKLSSAKLQKLNYDKNTTTQILEKKYSKTKLWKKIMNSNYDQTK